MTVPIRPEEPARASPGTPAATTESGASGSSPRFALPPAFLGVRARLLALALLALLPTVLVALETAGRMKSTAARAAEQDVARLTRLAAAPSIRLLRGTQQLLIALGRAPEVRNDDEAACRALFAGLIADDPRYLDLGIATPEGIVRASARSLVPRLRLGEAARRDRALERGGIAIAGAPHPTDPSKAVLHLAHRASGASPKSRLVFATLPLDWLELLAADAGLPARAEMVLVDERGTIVSRRRASGAAPDRAFVNAVAAGHDHLVSVQSEDGIARVVASTPLLHTPEYSLRLGIGWPRSPIAIRLDRQARNGLIGLALAALLALLWLWFSFDLLVVRRLKALLHAAERRIPAPARSPRGGELARLTAAFEELANALDARASEHERAAAVMDESRRLGAAFLEDGPAFAYLQDEQGQILHANRKFMWLAGEAPGALNGRTVEELWPEPVARQFREHDHWARVAAGPVQAIETFPGPDRRPRECVVVRFPVRDAAGRPCLGAVGIEIANPDAAEVSRRHGRAHAALLENALDPMLTLDRSGIVQEFNSAAERTFGIVRDAALGRTLDELLVPPGLRAQHQATWGRCLAAGEGDLLGRVVETTMRHADGREIPVELRVRRIPGEEPPRYVAQLRDLVERNGIRERLRRAEERLRESERGESTAREAMGHEFSNLLTALLGSCQLLRDRLPRDGEALHDVDEIERAVVRAAAITRDLRRVDGATTAAEPQDPSRILEDWEPEARRLAGSAIEVVCTSGSTGRVAAHPGEIEQMLACLVANARDAMPEGGRIRIRVESMALLPSEAPCLDGAKPGAHAVLSVEDEGVGMDDPTRARIFEPFFTTKKPGAGTGLGLPTVRGIVDRMGGHIEVRSEPGRGTTVVLYLPVVADPVRDEATPGPESTRAIEHTVLVVEAEDLVRRVVCAALLQRGFHVLEARDATAALELCRRPDTRVDLLVTAVSMPGLTGPELVERLPSRLQDARVLYLSWRTDPLVRKQCAASERRAFLLKPFTPAELLAQVRRLMRSAETLAA
jgi:PAS domain S-box-containing protein